MEVINLVILTPSSSFIFSLQELLSPYHQFQSYQLSSQKESLPPEISPSNCLLLVDLDALSGESEDIITELGEKFSGSPLVVFSDDRESVQLPSTLDAFLVDRDSISCEIFPSFLTLLSDQRKLIQDYSKSQAALNKRVHELDLLRKASLHLTMNLSLDAVLEAILDSAMELVSADDTHIFLYEP